MTTWEPRSSRVERVYVVKDTPDVVSAGMTRWYTVRPRTVTLYSEINTAGLVYGAVVEGQQVRRDGNPNERSNGTVCCGLGVRWYNTRPPAWINQLLADEGLEWQEPSDRVGGAP